MVFQIVLCCDSTWDASYLHELCTKITLTAHPQEVRFLVTTASSTLIQVFAESLQAAHLAPRLPLPLSECICLGGGALRYVSASSEATTAYPCSPSLRLMTPHSCQPSWPG